MEAKDTVMSPIDISRKVGEIVILSPMIGEAGVNIKIAELQAEISFKAGVEQEHKTMIGVAVDEGNRAYQAGRKEVVDFIGNPFKHNITANAFANIRVHNMEDCFACKYEAKLQKWGL